MGLKIDPENLHLIGSPQFIYPTPEYDPYSGIGLIILSYLHVGPWNTGEIKLNRVPEKGCMIKKYKLVPLPALMKEIEKWDINIYPNYAEKLLEIEKLLNEGKI